MQLHTQLNDPKGFKYSHRRHCHAPSQSAKAPTFAGSEGSFAESEDDDSEDHNDEFDDMDDANEADADGAAEQDIASSSGNDSQLPTPPERGGQSEAMKRGPGQHPKHSNAQDLRATGVARAAARLLQQDTPADGLGILSVRASAAAIAHRQSCSLILTPHPQRTLQVTSCAFLWLWVSCNRVFCSIALWIWYLLLLLLYEAFRVWLLLAAG